MKRPLQIILTVLFWTMVMAPLQAKRLSEVWPEAYQQGQFCDLKLKFRLGDKLVLQSGSRWCIWLGQVIPLKSPAIRIGDDWELPHELSQSIAHVLKKREPPKPVPPPKKKTDIPVIVIDPGHGGKDPGKIGPGGIQEKDIVLDISHRVSNLLKKHNVKVYLTRTTDEFIDLSRRCEISNARKASIFVSIHCNSHPKSHITGHQLYTMDPNRVSVHERADFVARQFTLPKYSPTMHHEHRHVFKNHAQLMYWKDKESEELADHIEYQLNYRNSKVRTRVKANFCVIRETMAPSVLVETDYLSNSAMEVQMSKASWRQKMAKDIYKGILDYLGIQPR